MEYHHYDGMGVLITWEILEKSRKPSDHDDYPYLYEGTLRRITYLLLQ
jgi:hypothetical protein